jgi:hypothetical protein
MIISLDESQRKINIYAYLLLINNTWISLLFSENYKWFYFDFWNHDLSYNFSILKSLWHFLE